MEAVNYKIKDIEWSFKIQEDRVYEQHHGRDSAGITIKDKLQVFFRKSDFSLKLVRHELFHVYFASCCITSTHAIDADDTEEIGAEIIEYHLDELVSKSKQIYCKLKKEIYPKKPSKKKKTKKHKKLIKAKNG